MLEALCIAVRRKVEVSLCIYAPEVIGQLEAWMLELKIAQAGN